MANVEICCQDVVTAMTNHATTHRIPPKGANANSLRPTSSSPPPPRKVLRSSRAEGDLGNEQAAWLASEISSLPL
jgi:hypothetical protein